MGPDPDYGSRIGIESANTELVGLPEAKANPIAAGTAEHLTNSDPDAYTNREPDSNSDPDSNTDHNRDANANPDPNPNSDPDPNPNANPNPNPNADPDTSPNSLGVRSAGPDPPPDQPCGDGAPECDAAG